MTTLTSESTVQERNFVPLYSPEREEEIFPASNNLKNEYIGLSGETQANIASLIQEDPTFRRGEGRSDIKEGLLRLTAEIMKGYYRNFPETHKPI